MYLRTHPCRNVNQLEPIFDPEESRLSRSLFPPAEAILARALDPPAVETAEEQDAEPAEVDDENMPE